MSANLGWLFYKGYFEGIDWQNLDSNNNQELINEKIDNLLNQQYNINDIEYPTLGNIHFKATTTYPGLLLGSGYLHELPDVKEQAILGFDFDYTTGLPIIRGSSIKGVLRSAFREEEYIKEVLGKSDIDIKKLEIEIFGQDSGSSEASQGKDIFFDTVITTYGTKLLEDDYLCPHGDNPLKNPTPLRFIKVAPNVTFRFDFMLSDGLISKEQKSKLFQQILEDFGVGAKTNVGYGKFENFKKFKTKNEIEKEKQEEKRREEEERKRINQEKMAKKEAKEKEKQEALKALNSCKNLQEAIKILNEKFGKKPKVKEEERVEIEKFYFKYKNRATKNEKKFFKKYGIST